MATTFPPLLTYTVSGIIYDEYNAVYAGVTVEAYDQDPLRLGSCLTNQ